MKKQILTLTLCLALTATTALASASAVAKKTCTKIPEKVAAKVVKEATPVINKAEGQAVTLTPEQLAKKKFEDREAKDREELYCKLALSSEQKLKARALDAKTRAEAEPLFAKARCEREKLKDLKAKNACPIAICEQRHAVKVARRALQIYKEASRKSFEAILTKDQLSQYEALRAARKEEHKKHKKYGNTGQCDKCDKCDNCHKGEKCDKCDKCEKGGCEHKGLKFFEGAPEPKCPCNSK